MNEPWSAPFLTLPGLITREAGSPREKCQRIWCFCGNLAVKLFPSLLQQFFLLKASWRWHQQISLSPLLCLLFTLTSSFHQMRFLCSLQWQIWLICWFSSIFPPHSSGLLFLLTVSFKTSVGTQEVKLQCMEIYFLLSLCSVWRGFVKVAICFLQGFYGVSSLGRASC